MLKLIEKLNLNLDFLLQNPEGKQVGQLIELLALMDQCIDQTMLLIQFEELDGHLPQAGNQLSH